MNKPLVSPPVADAAQSTRTPDEAREQARVYHEWMMGVAALAASQPLEIWTPMQFHRDGKLVGDVEWSDEERGTDCEFARKRFDKRRPRMATPGWWPRPFDWSGTRKQSRRPPRSPFVHPGARRCPRKGDGGSGRDGERSCCALAKPEDQRRITCGTQCCFRRFAGETYPRPRRARRQGGVDGLEQIRRPKGYRPASASDRSENLGTPHVFCRLIRVRHTRFPDRIEQELTPCTPPSQTKTWKRLRMMRFGMKTYPCGEALSAPSSPPPKSGGLSRRNTWRRRQSRYARKARCGLLPARTNRRFSSAPTRASK